MDVPVKKGFKLLEKKENSKISEALYMKLIGSNHIKECSIV